MNYYVDNLILPKRKQQFKIISLHPCQSVRTFLVHSLSLREGVWFVTGASPFMRQTSSRRLSLIFVQGMAGGAHGAEVKGTIHSHYIRAPLNGL